MSDQPVENSQSNQYDPSEHNVAEVQQYMEEHPDQVDQIKAAEQDGKKRSTILNYDVETQDSDENPDADGNDVISPEKTNADGDVVMGAMTTQSDEEQEEAKQSAEEKSAAVANGGDVEDYSPYTDPLVPSSTMAEAIATELKSGEGSPTLQALHDNKPEPKERDDKSTQ